MRLLDLYIGTRITHQIESETLYTIEYIEYGNPGFK